MEAIYTTEALATGAGRDGQVSVAESPLSFDLASPKALGGSGEGANPEQLFAAGYAACFHSALQAVARSKKVAIEGSSVGARVGIGSNGEGGFALAVELEVVIPDLDAETAQSLADAAHQVCPYSNATRGNIDVKVSVSDD
ncbi:organic hydroperoxide resistance protein [Microbacterium oryzae]|uniref:Organic hydroperoxide resistance protein n=1 Tax=Microbacterium oryzae TaxID=743009 RepID=A0A6I6E3R8_9MICO|nr:organic hydroperoxide resistance protein [Microbacterium oryzae]QGU27417.1 organic hydroperoxide resistance protein [Microbacterium oryzae]